MKDRENRSTANRRNDPALRHGRNESDRLEQNRLAAGIRPADEDRAFRFGQVEVKRNDCGVSPEEERMATVPNDDGGRGLTDGGHLAIDIYRIATASHDIVHPNAHRMQIGD